MNNEQKKEYTAPKMEILVIEQKTNLLCGSGEEGCIDASFVGPNA